MKPLLQLLSISCLAIVLSGCADHMLSADGSQAQSGEQTLVSRTDAPTQGKLRHPQVMDDAFATKRGDKASKYGAQNAHLFVAFAEYEADGVTRRVLDSYGVTRRILQEYGVTRRVLQEYGVTRRVLEEYGITRRVMEEYGGLTFELLEDYLFLEANGVTRRVLDDYGVTRRDLEDYAETYQPEIEVRVRINHVRPGVTIAFVADFLDTFLEEIADDPDIELVEPDVELEGAPLYLKDGLRHDKQMMPWNIASAGATFVDFSKDDVDVFILDSGVYDRDLNIVEAKDFTMLFQNREEEMWDDSEVINMPFFDPGEMGDPVDRNGHGTHGAGTIGAKDNDDGTKGMAPEARIHSLKVLTDDGRTDITTVVSAIDYVTDFKQQNPTQPVVANMSLGMDLESTAYNILDEAVKRAIDFGVVVVVSAGNDYADASTYSPAHVYEAITVGAYDRHDEFAAFSNYGSAIDILAPGDQVVSLTHLESEAANDDNIVLSGTSMAAPHVAGAAALYLVQHPYASPAEVKQALINAADARVQNVPQGTTTRALNVGFADDGNTKAFEVKHARYEVSASGTRKLKFEGHGPRLDTVVLTNAARGTEMTTMFVQDDGNWKYEVVEPEIVPCAVDVAYLGGTHDAQTVRQPVEFAPGSCEPLLALTKVEWKSDEELVVEGDLASGVSVVLTDSQTGYEIATLVAGSNHEFDFATQALNDPPCRVTATTAGDSVDAVVEDADLDDCSGGLGMTIEVSLKKAEYDQDKDKLTVEGEVHAGATVTFVSPASGNAFGTEVAGNNGSFKLQEENPSIIPCVVRVVSSLDGSVAERPVIKKGFDTAPSNCEKVFAMEHVKWHANDEKLELKGLGPYNGTVTFRNSRTGDVVHTATLDDRGGFDDDVTGLQHVPCSLIIEHQGQDFVSYESPIENVPSNCDVDLVFNLLQYTAIYNRLSAGGIATAGSMVTLRNADTGETIRTVFATEDRTWRADMDLSESGDNPPCRVEAAATNGDVLVSTVNPMADCNPDFVYTPVEGAVEQNPYSYIELSRADYNQTARTLRVSGNGYEFMEITVRNPVTGETFGSMTNDDTPAFDFYVDIPGTIPCGITAELDGRQTDRAVSNTTPNCDDHPFLDMASWKDGVLQIEGLGGAGMPAELNSTGRGLFASSTFDQNGALSLQLDSTTLDWIPCEIEMTSNGGSVTLPVNGAPDFCDGTPVLLLTKWANGQLMLTARGGFGAEVAITATNRGEAVTSGTFDSNGMFSIGLPASQLAYVPCQLTFSTEGMTATSLVTNSPDSCDGTPFVNEARWNGGYFLFEAEGPMSGDYRISSTQRPETLFDSQFSEEGLAELSLSGDQGIAFMPSEILLEYRHRPGAELS
ncbi:MAG: S8 family serine peptidase, partial [Rhodothermales bacterium]|nr:S8 family serine peptidase [Rhodothermales bacterium]